MAGHSGIGFSGVGYAITGFGWIASKYRPELSGAFSHKTITMFIGWGILCLALTMLGLLRVGNIAHGSGFAFGALIAWGSYKKSLPARIAATLVLLVSAIHINWNPYSSHWIYAKAGQAMDRADYDRAVPLFKRSLELGYDPEMVWHSLAEIYGYQRNLPAYTEALDVLKKINPTAADEVIKVYGLPSGRPVE